MLSKQLESAIADEVAKSRASFIRDLKVSILFAVERVFDRAESGQLAASLPKKKPGRPPAPVKKKKRYRAKVTPELRAEIIRQLQAGKFQRIIARDNNVSLMTVQRARARWIAEANPSAS